MVLAGDINVITVFALSLVRILAVFLMIPVFQTSILPGGIRTAVAISMTLVLYPAMAEQAALADLAAVRLLGLVIKEAVIGLLIGFGAAVMFWAIESAGFFIDNQRGSAMASSVDPLTGSQTSPLGIFLTQVLTVFFIMGGGFIILLAVVYKSYQLFPVFTFFPRMDLDGAVYALALVDRIMAFALVMAAPAMIAMFLAEFGLGLVSRFAPQLNVFFLAMPVKSAVGILMLVLYLGLLQEVWSGGFQDIFRHLDRLQEVLE